MPSILPARSSRACDNDIGALHPSSGSETILLVDDEELVRSFERVVLENSGYRVLEADGPLHALELAETPRSGNPSARNGRRDAGTQRTSTRSAADAQPRMKTLYTSGYASGAIAHHGILEPGVFYLQKPLNVLTLANKIRDVLDAA